MYSCFTYEDVILHGSHEIGVNGCTLEDSSDIVNKTSHKR